MQSLCAAVLTLRALLSPSELQQCSWSIDPNVRMEHLLHQSESTGPIRRCPETWMIDQPSHLTPIRVHGGIGP
jgi:hypothetical protein